MKYKRAQDILPDDLLKELQQYVSGETLYIPRPHTKRKWGATSGAQRYYQERNERILSKFKSGDTIDSLADEFNLSTDSIKKIIYRNPGTENETTDL